MRPQRPLVLPVPRPAPPSVFRSCRGGPSRRARRDDESGVADTVGSVLLVGITVAMSILMGALLLNFKGPTATPQANLSVTVSPGAGGWGTGDEELRITHLGGDALRPGETTVSWRVNGVTASATGTAVAASLQSGPGALPPQGTWSIGRTFVRTLTLQATDSVDVFVVASGGTSSLLATASLVPAQVAAAATCPFDVTPPTVAWVQNPSDVASTTATAVTVTATITDDCSGLAANLAPRIWYSIGVNAVPTDKGAMAPAGVNQWSATIPSPYTAGYWSGRTGQTLTYYAAGLVDQKGNQGSSPPQTDFIQLDCSGDTAGPTVATWSQSPSDVNVRSSGPVTVTATMTDNCAGVDPNVNPQLYYRTDGGAWIAAAPLAHPSSLVWTGTIPEPSARWCALAGQTLEYEVRGMADLRGNTATSARQTDPVGVTCSYVATMGGVGAVTNLANARSASDAQAAATLAEVTTSSATLSGNGATGPAGSSPTNALTCSDSLRATLQATGDTLSVGGFTAPAGATGIRRITLSAQAARTSSGTGTPTFTLGYRLGAAGATSQTYTPGSSTDATFGPLEVTADRGWTVADLANLQLTVTSNVPSTRGITVNCLTATITYSGAGTGSYALDLVMDFTAPSAQQLEVAYKTSGETFDLQVWDGTSYNSRATLSSVAFTTAIVPLTAAEANGGSPRVRIMDSNPAGSTAGSLTLDYARITGV